MEDSLAEKRENGFRLPAQAMPQAKALKYQFITAI